MDVVYARCAGLDVHKKSVTACVLLTEGGKLLPKQIRVFSTMLDDLQQLSRWLSAQGVTHVAMESTGVYWQPIVRHEALCIREGMREPFRETVAAVSRS